MQTKARTVLHLFVSAAVAVLFLGGGLVLADPSDRSTPVVLELFTSQGCSGCPPADRLLSRLGDEGVAGNVEVIPLSFHVDYWNYIGWTDPFSSGAWSDRQRLYASLMQLDTIYTPQIVIQGGAQVVGSSAESVLREIARARSRGTAVAVEIEVEPTTDRIEVGLATRIDNAIPGHGLELLVALFEKRLVTPVARGENASRTLENDYVVRALEQAFEIKGARGTSQSGSVTFRIDPAWKRHDLGIAAFAQDPASLAIYGAASSPTG